MFQYYSNANDPSKAYLLLQSSARDNLKILYNIQIQRNSEGKLEIKVIKELIRFVLKDFGTYDNYTDEGHETIN